MEQPLERKLSVATWNVRGLRPKLPEIAKILEKQEIDVCGLQETKTEGELEEQGYDFICFNRDNKAYGIGFAVKKSVKFWIRREYLTELQQSPSRSAKYGLVEQ